MFVIMLTMLVIVLLAVAVAALVMVGMKGQLQETRPELSNRLAEVARHMNGDAEPPKALKEYLERDGQTILKDQTTVKAA